VEKQTETEEESAFSERNMKSFKIKEKQETLRGERENNENKFLANKKKVLLF